MSAATASAPPIDIGTGPGIPLPRLVKIELRKMVDTRAGFWLLASIAILSALVMVIQLWVAAAQDLTLHFTSFIDSMSSPMAVLLPVLGILSVTSEWGQRTGLVTFTLEPRRSRIVSAKLLAGLVVAIAAVVVAMVLAVVGNVLVDPITGSGGDWNTSASGVFDVFVLQAVGLTTGFAFGMLIMNTAAAIVLFFVYQFVLPGLFAWLAAVAGWFKDLQPWVDFGYAQGPLMSHEMDGEGWAHFAVSGTIWLILPLTLGILRLLRSEVK